MPLAYGQPVEVLDVSGGDLWLVKTVDSATGKPVEGLVRRSTLVSKPPPKAAPAENGMETRQNGNAVSKPVRQSDKVHLRGHPPPSSSSTAAVMPGTLFGTYEPPQSIIFGTPQVKDEEIPSIDQSVKKDTPPLEHLPPPSVPTVSVQSPTAANELRKLQEASVNSQVQLDDFDPIEMYVAIADFQALEESSISLKAGEHVQVSVMSYLIVGLSHESHVI